ncbi:hypothetical protein Dda_7595 [Drechslerella dactyloides]|uniref:Uncharacterized protein n=1 Tax=Drechslerella dactyloides TaxID=74499 RepID=A0AAD6IW11_DREDA|nr:hypothetical protein Dda_7595 [Drechslerella dactyloides]
MAARIAKRPRLHGPNNPALSLASTSSLLESTRQSAAAAASTPKLRQLQADHENSLRQSALRLKSNWEDICRRYGRDFSGETDEIDLHTGEVVVDNGHLRNLSENNDDTWAFDEFSGTLDEDGDGDEDGDCDEEEEEDAGSAATGLEMEIMGMTPGDMLGGGRLGVHMPRDDEAEEVDVDEMDDLFDELEELTMTMQPADDKPADTLPQKDPSGRDGMPSPASSVDGTMPSPATKPAETENVEVPSLDELPPDAVILEKLGPKWGSALLARVRALPEPNHAAEVEEEPESFNAQLTPVSDYATPVVERPADEMDDATAEEDESDRTIGVPAVVDESLNVASEEEVDVEKEGLEMSPEVEAYVEAPAEPLESVNIALEATAEEASPAPVLTPETEPETLAEAVPFSEQEDGTHDRPFMIEDTPEPEPAIDTIPEPSPLPVEVANDVRPPEPPREPSTAPEQPTMDEQPVDPQPETMDPNYLYGDIDDLSTISSPRSLVPVTPKNRFRIKAKSAIARKVVSAKRGRPPKRLLSDLDTPAQHAMSSPLRPTHPPSSPPAKRPRQQQADPRQPRNFWSALPNDPFYDPAWQDYHPDGEPSFEDFEQRRRLLQQHSLKENTDSDAVMTDELTPVASSPATAKKTPKPKVKATPKKTTKTPRSQNAKGADMLEAKLHTPRSGRFLEHLQKRAAEGAVKAEEEASGHPAAVTASTPNAQLETPSRRIKDEYGLSDSEDELSRELLFVKDKDLEITGSRKRVRRPLIVRDDPPLLSKRGDAMKEEEDDAAEQRPPAVCGDPGYRCKKTVCFSKIFPNESLLQIVC